MAFSFSIDASAVKPYDLNLYLGVLMDHRERNDKYKDVLEKLYLQASLLKSAVLDSSALSIYDAYMDKLNNATEALNSGLTMESANLANEARKQFSRDILPMEDARLRYLEELKFRRQEIAGGKPILYSSKNLPTFDAFYTNLPVKRGYNAEGLSARLGAVAKAVGESMQNDVGFLEVLDGLQIRIDETGGIPYDIIEGVINGDYDGQINEDTKSNIELLVKTYEQEKQAADYNNLDDVDKALFDSYARAALSLGAQSTKTSFTKNLDLERSADKLTLLAALDTMLLKLETNLLVEKLSKLDDPNSKEYRLTLEKLKLLKEYGLSSSRKNKSEEDDEPDKQKYVMADIDGKPHSNDTGYYDSYSPNSATAVYIIGKNSKEDVINKLVDSYRNNPEIYNANKESLFKTTVRDKINEVIRKNNNKSHLGFTIKTVTLDGIKGFNENDPLKIDYFTDDPRQ